MRKLLIGLAFIINSPLIFCQLDEILIPDSCIEENEIIDPIEIMAEFPGGNDSLICFIEKELNWDLINSIDTIGKFFIQFKVDTIGKSEYLKTFRSLDSQLDNEFERIINELPLWKPAEQSGIKVSTSWTLPIKIPYEKKCK